MSLDGFWAVIKSKANVVGYSKKLRSRVKNGQTTNEQCFRIYVAIKLPLSSLKIEDVIPSKIEDVPTDVVEIGKIKALKNTDRVRPLVAGVSIGNWSITAGTLGWFFKDGRGHEMLGSNAHVFAEDALKEGSSEKRIIQPGRHDEGSLSDVVGQYYWHKSLGEKSDCPLSKDITSFLNWTSSFLRRKTYFPPPRFEGEHHIDFALAEATVDFELLMMGLENFDEFFGLGFAGSDQASYFCKAEYILTEQWNPIDKKVATVLIDDIVHKVGRTTEYTQGRVLDDSAHGQVWYSDYDVVEFDDVILTEAMLEGGDSGSAGWLYSDF